MRVIANPSEATPLWLTQILRREGLLPSSAVAAVRAETLLIYNSEIHRLSLTYSPEAPHPAPRTLILKIKQGEGARDELAMHNALAPHRPALPMLMPWYDAAYSAERDLAHFLLPDLSPTHVQTVSVTDATGGRPLPAPHHLEQIIDTIATWHAYWWDHSSLDREIGPIHGGYRSASEFHRTIMRQRQSNWSDFIAQEAPSISAARRAMFERGLAHLPNLYERRIAPRLRERRNITLIHGDCYFGQFMCPKDATTGAQTILMDLESANTFLAAIDLAFLFATFWPRTIRQQDDRERRCLLRYQQRVLSQCSTIRFTFDELLEDYRLAIALMIFYPIWDKVVGGSDRTYWWPKLQCLCDAYEDLRCDRLLTDHADV